MKNILLMSLAERKEYSNKYKAYVLAILTGVYTFNFIDRQILVILQESIKADLGLTDTQLGMLTGLTFALFYVTLGIPVARLADRSNRKNIVAISLALWSFMTALSGSVANFFQLLLARIGVGVGEAGGSPPSHSMISDYFPPERRATALSIYSVGIYIGILVGYIAGGWLDQLYGWRIALMALGVPGILYAIILYFTVEEPERGRYDQQKRGTEDDKDSFGDVVRYLFSKRTFVLLAVGCGLHAFGSYGVGNFFPSFLARVHQMPIGEIGTWLGLCTGIGGGIGTFLGGYLCDKYGKENLRYYLWIPALTEILSLPFAVGAFFLGNTTLAMACFFLMTLIGSLYLGPMIAVSHNLVKPSQRAMASAILFFVLNLIGLGLGPLVMGALSDALQPSLGAQSLRYAFCLTFVTGLIVMVLFYSAGKSYEEDLKS